MKELKVAIIGYGGIARAHNKGYHILKNEGFPISVVAYVDVDPKKFDGEVAINTGSNTTPMFEGAARFTSADELLASGLEFDSADICVPGYLHKEMACKLLNSGKHVQVEKPMALCSEDCYEMIECAKKNDRRLMVGQCLRFSSYYLYLKDIIDSGKYGKIKNLYMNRLSAFPRWGFEDFYSKTEGCGGCIMDLHIHDIDMARFLLGEPELVSSVGYDGITRWINVSTRLLYPEILVSANASFDEVQGVPFRMAYRARFEGASVIFEDGKITVYPEDGEKYVADIEIKDHMAEEIRYFATTILENKPNDKNPPESAAASVKMIETLRESIAKRGENIKI